MIQMTFHGWGLKMHNEIVTRGHRNLMGEMTYTIVVQGRRS